MRDERVHPVSRSIARLHVLEEARHVSFAKTYLAEILPTLDDADRQLVADAAPALVAVVADLSVDPAVYEHLGIIDGYEAAHPLMFSATQGRRDLRAFEQRARAIKPGLAAIGSTDFHFFAPLGFCRTFVFATERSAPAILDAIKRGRTVACDAAGEVYGAAELMQVVSDACRAAAGSPARDASSAGRLGAALLWFGLFAVILLGHSENPENPENLQNLENPSNL